MTENLWSRQALIAQVDEFNRPLVEELSHEEIESIWLGGELKIRTAFKQVDVKIDKWKLPASIEFVSPPYWYIIAMTMAYGTKFGQYPTPTQTNYLCHAEASADMKSIVDYVAPDFHASPATIHSTPIPDALLVDPDAVELARAFTKQMLDNTPDLPTPFIGEFRMTRTGIDLVDALNLQEIRFVITNTGLWFSLIFQDDTFCPAWWSAFGDTLIINFGQRYSWIFRTFLACIWHDLHITEESVFHVSRDRKRFGKGTQNKNNERIISLPRKVRSLTWDDGMTRHFEEGRGDYSVRAHYRRLHDEHWQASDEAVLNARQSGFPEPPDGFTFVRAYDVGSGGDKRPPRIIAKGLHAAKVALSDL